MKTLQQKSVLTLIGLSLVLSGWGSPAPVDAEVKIMPLGDSITDGAVGSTDDTGYRRSLYLSLTGAGYDPNFVGSLSSGIPGDFDRDHEGHGGQTAAWINPRLNGPTDNWLPAYEPKIILYHIGTNNLGGSDIEAYAQDANETLEIIYDYDPSIIVVLAKIILTTDSARNTRTHNYNVLLEEIAQDWADAGYPITIVDMENALTYPDDLDDTVHPNDTGYEKMANVWFDALDDILGYSVWNLQLAATSPGNLTSDDLICSYNLGQEANTAATAWYKDGSPIMRLYLPMEGNSINALLDYSGNDIGVTTSGDPNWNATTGFDGNGAFEFDGDDDLSAGENFPTSSSYTKTAWVYRTGSGLNGGNNIISGDENSGGHAFWAPDTYSNKLSAGHNGTWNVVQDSAALALSTWYFVAVTYDYDTDIMTLYKYGVPIDSTTVGEPDVTDMTISIGSFGSGNGFMWQGTIDDARIYDFVLSPEQIQAMFNSGLGNANVIVSEETSTSEEWQAQVTASSSTQTGPTSLSNTITIMPEAPGTGCPSNIVAYWRLDEETAGSYKDSISDNNGICAGVCPDPCDDGKVNGTQVFDGSTTGINVSDDDAFDWSNTDNFTIEFWMKKDVPVGSGGTNDNEVIIGRDDGSLHWWLGVQNTSGAIHFQMRKEIGGNNWLIIEGPKVDDGKWHHIVAIRDGDSAENWLYVDGNDVNSISGAYSEGFESDANLNIGWLNLSAGYHYEGLLDEFAIYNRDISEREFLGHYYLARGYCEGCDTPVRIMPLGDSITYDNHSGDVRPEGERISYRYPLWQLLTDDGYNFDFVGSVWAGYDIFPDANNAGYPGARDDEIADLLDTGVSPKAGYPGAPGPYLEYYPADIILLHIGTNALDTSAADVEDILDEVDEYETLHDRDVTVLLARIINRMNYVCPNPSTTTTFNNEVQIMAEARIANGDKIIIVDLECGAGIDYSQDTTPPYDDGDMFDNLHPNDDGYAKMAQAWFDVLETFLPVCGPELEVCPPNMISYWKLDEQTSGSYEDFYGYNDAVCVGVCPEPNANGQVGFAQVFDGSTTEIDAQGNLYNWTQNDSFTIELWMKKDVPVGNGGTADNEVIVSRDDSLSNLHWWFGVQNTSGQATFQLRDTTGAGGAVINGPRIDNGQWHHLVALRDGLSNINHLYVDGNEVASNSFSYAAGFDSAAAALNIGWINLIAGDGGYYWYNGTLDELAIYNKALSSSEITQHYLNGLDAKGYCEGGPPIPPAITSTPVTQAYVGEPYTYNVDATGTPEPNYALTEFPGGMTIDHNTGLIEWTPAATGDSDVNVVATNSEGSDSQAFNIHVTEAPVCPDDMSHYWKLDDDTIPPIVDFFADNDGTCSGGNCPEPNDNGIVGKTLDFDGSNEYFTVADDDSLDWASTDSFTIELWAKFTNVSNRNKVMIGRDQSGGYPHWWLGANQDTGKANCNLLDKNRNGIAVTSSTSINDNNWHHIVFVREESLDENRLYVDGILEDLGTHNYTAGFEAATTLGVGYMAYNGNPDYYYDGLLDEVALYDRALTLPEIEQHYLNGLSGMGYCLEQPTAPTIISTPVTQAYVGEPYTYDVDATGTPEPNYALTEFPGGMTIDFNTGLIEWTPASLGDYDVNAVATNSEGSDTQAFTINVAEAPVCPQGMTSYWKLNENISGSYEDYYNGNDGTCIGLCPTPTAGGKVGWAQVFDGDNTGIDAPGSDFNWGKNDSFSIEFWMKRDNPIGSGGIPDNEVIVGRDDASTELHWWFGIKNATGAAHFQMGDKNKNSIAIEGPAIDDGQWHHLVGVRDGVNEINRLYVDGNDVNSVSMIYGAGFDSASAALNLGWLNLSDGFNFEGTLDEVAIYDRMLPSPEVQQHYLDGLAGSGYCQEGPSAPTIVSTPVTEAYIGQLYSYDVDAIGVPEPNYALTESPGGMTINFNTGLIEWTPASTGDSDVNVVATNTEGSDTQSFTIHVSEQPICPQAMVSYWKMNDTTIPPIVDYFGGNDGTCSSCPDSNSSGIVNGALYFDGSDEVDVADINDDFDWGKDDSFTIEYWMKTAASTSGNRVIVGRDDSSTKLHWWIGCDDSGKVRFQLKDVNENGPYIGDKGPVLNDGQWHLVAAVRDDANGKNIIYVDGNSIDEATHDYTAGFGSSVAMNIGYINLGGYYRYEGLVDEVAIYDRALTKTELLDHYNLGQGKEYCYACQDSDGDGICNENDNCPDAFNPDQNDVDLDGAGDICDDCPFDPNKTDPGICGCGLLDTDIDSDGTPDCIDGCPSDPNKTDPGICGCGLLDTDTDGDIILDCLDNCPSTYNPDQNDTDMDGIGNICECQAANLDGLGCVDFEDFAILASHWSTAGSAGDTDRNGTVDTHDLAQLAQHWLSICISCMVDVPIVVGLNETDANTALTNVGLIKGAVTYDYNDTIPAGNVMDSTPTAGTSVPCGLSVDLLISDGPCLVVIPVVVGLSETDANTALTTAGLIKGTVTHDYNDTIPAGNVADSTPTAGTSVPCGSSVDLVISDGPCMVDVPVVVNLSEADANTALTAVGLIKGTVTHDYNDTIPAGNVADSTPTAGTSVPCGSSVDLLISDGPYVVGDWLGINSSHIDSACGGTGLEGALDGDNFWSHYATHQHWFILDLGDTYNITKARGRSNTPEWAPYDPTDVDIYVSDNKTTWGTAVATGISSWQDTDSWVEESVTPKDGRYIKVVINSTEDIDNYLVWGDWGGAWNIFDVFGEP